MNAVEFKGWLKKYKNEDSHTPLVMGILNMTPDSFSDGGKYLTPEIALKRALEMLEQGADIIDVGGESSRPGAVPVSLQEELDRVIPVIEKLRYYTDCCISIDTYKPEVMAQAVARGANVINDIYALQHPGAAEFVVRQQLPVCLMHMRGMPQTMAEQVPVDADIFSEIKNFLKTQIEHLQNLGLATELIMIDPGIGFGKTTEQNLKIIKELHQLKSFNLPILLGVSNKRFIGDVLRKEVHARSAGSLSSQLIGYLKGATILRTHDVATTKETLKMANAIINTK